LSQAAVPALEQGCTVIYVAVDGRPAGFLALADTLRPDAAGTIRDVRATGVTPVLLTGDHERAARHIAGELGIGTFQAECLPEDKLTWIDRSQQSGHLVCMVGDGINDAPALARADVGFAMAGNGTDTAIETADVALMDDDLRKIPRFIRLSRATFAILVQNITLALGVKALFFALTFTGHATMWMAVFADVGTALLVVANGLRAMRQ